MASLLKRALEDVLQARGLRASVTTPFRGRCLSTGRAEIDGLLGGGFPHGQTSEIHGPVSSGRTSVAFGVAGKVADRGGVVAWIDTTDGFDPVAARGAGVGLSRLLWVRGGRGPADALSALGILLGSGLFELAVWDLIGVSRNAILGLPGATWLRLQRMVEGTSAVLLLLGENHVFRSPGGRALSLRATEVRWAHHGPGRWLCEVSCRASTGPPFRETSFCLRAHDGSS
ncbi:MAG: hypothetical protein JXO72_03235 [Vicinamibacteria bacterium]|nr:hypothetical protein [Vicinamibacteria bacterium]